MRRALAGPLVLLLLGALAGRAAAAGRVLARVGGEPVTEAYVAAALRARGADAEGAVDQAFLRHVVDMKLFAMYARQRMPERTAAVEREVRWHLDELLAERFELEAVRARVAAVTEADVDAAYVPYRFYDIDRYFFAVPAEAEIFMQKYRDDPEAYKAAYTFAAFRDLSPSYTSPEELREALPRLSVGDWFGPVALGRKALVFHIRRADPPSAELVEKDRGVVRRRLEQERYEGRLQQVRAEVDERFQLQKNLGVLGEIFAGRKITDLDPATVLASFTGGTITAGDVQEAAGRTVRRSGHPFYTSSRLKIFYEEMERQTLFAMAARDLDLDEDPAIASEVGYFTDQAWSVAFSEGLLEDARRLSEEDLRAFHDGHRLEFQGSFEDARADVARRAADEKRMRLVEEAHDAAVKAFPVEILLEP